MADVFRRQEFFLRCRLEQSNRTLGRFIGHHLLVELIAARDVFLRHDRLFHRFLPEHLGRVTILSDG